MWQAGCWSYESQPKKTMSLPSRSLQSGEETHTTQTDAKLQLSGALRWRGIWCWEQVTGRLRKTLMWKWSLSWALRNKFTSSHRAGRGNSWAKALGPKGSAKLWEWKTRAGWGGGGINSIPGLRDTWCSRTIVSNHFNCSGTDLSPASRRWKSTSHLKRRKSFKEIGAVHVILPKKPARERKRPWELRGLADRS